ncbi:Crp/Fnr family transcriptional regulator [Hyphomicrobium denitrificans]|nr:helix-turn-helix domain-containing protein [Hyphomicrobium denitrificans]
MNDVTQQQSTRCDACTVRHRAVCGALSQKEIERLNAIARHRTVPQGQAIVGDQDRVLSFANIISGVVKLTKTLCDGRQQIVGLQFASDFIGRPFRDRSAYEATAVNDVHLCIYDRRQFEHLVREFPGFERRLFENTLDELDAARDWMLLLGRKSAEEKVASFILMVSKKMDGVSRQGGDGRPAKFELPITRTEIADFLGLTIETVSRQVSRLKSEKIIALEGLRTVAVLDVPRLEQASSG